MRHAPVRREVRQISRAPDLASRCGRTSASSNSYFLVVEKGSDYEESDISDDQLADPAVPLVSVEKLAGRDERTTTLLDVRTVPEYAEGHVPGAQLLPLHVLVEGRTEVVTTGAVYVVCGSGTRSAVAVTHLRARGVDARAVDGGVRAWTEAGHVLER